MEENKWYRPTYSTKKDKQTNSKGKQIHLQILILILKQIPNKL